jgi:hypothetical protein
MQLGGCEGFREKRENGDRNNERTRLKGRNAMNISRRNFLIGGASFASLGAFGGNRFRRAAAGFKAGGRPRLRFGVLSDIHILRIGANEDMAIGGVRFTVTPMNCFGARGKPISAEVKA